MYYNDKAMKGIRKRNEDIVKRKLAYPELTLEELGAPYDITRERVRQVLRKALGPDYKMRPPRTKFSFVCANKNCGKSFTAYTPKRKYCSWDCMPKYATKEEREQAKRDRLRWRYHNDPEYLARFKANQRRSHVENMTPERRARLQKKQREYNRRYWANMDPAEKMRRRERDNAMARARWARKTQAQKQLVYEAQTLSGLRSGRYKPTLSKSARARMIRFYEKRLGKRK